MPLPWFLPSNPRDECEEGEDEELRICQEGNGRRGGREDHLTEMTLQCPVGPMVVPTRGQWPYRLASTGYWQENDL